MINPIKYALNDMPVKWRLTLTNLILVLVPLAIVWLIFYGRFFSIIERTVLESHQTSSLQIKGKVEGVLENMISSADRIADNRDLDDFLRMKSADFVSDSSSHEYLLSSLKSFYAVAMSQIDEKNITDIKIYLDGSHINLNYAALGRDTQEGFRGIFDNISKIENTYWYGVFASSDRERLLAPGYMLSSRELEDHGDMALISRIYYSDNGSRKTAYIAVYHSQYSIEESLLETMTIDNGSAYILNEWDYLVASTDEINTGAYMMRYDDLSMRFPGNGTYSRTEIAAEDVFIGYRDIDFSDWRIVWVIPYASLLIESKALVIEFIKLYSFFIILVLILGMIIANSLVKRLLMLRNQMQHVDTEYPKQLRINAGKDEIGDLIQAYNVMAGKINTLTREKIKSSEELSSARLQALRAQIEPHFLYNTLDMINWLSRNNDNQKASEAVMALSRFYRLSLNKGNLTTTVAEELEHVSLYVKLMNMRYRGKINFIIDVPDEIMDFKIPMVILQPIVENSIQHGIQENTVGSGNISLAGWTDGKTIFFQIEDDGVGISEELMKTLTTSVPKENSESGIGVFNTHRRLQLSSEEEISAGRYGLSYKSSIGKGTEVTLAVPILQQEGDGEDEYKN